MIEFNGIASDSFADILSIQLINRPLSPGARAHTLEIAGREGVYYFGKDSKAQNVSFRLVLKSDTIAERRTAIRSIAAWLDTDDPKILSFTDEPEIIYYAVLIDPIPVEEFALVGRVNVSFLIPDGCAYSANLKEREPQPEIQNLYLGGATGGTFKLGRENYAWTWEKYDGLTWNEVI